ncbi:MAG: PD-(D/E)XK nuclease family protein, partial [Pseudomonadota bacterium]
VMTVHGAKGLEAPVVILPDTMKQARLGGNAAPRLVAAGEVAGRGAVLWLGPREEDDRRAAEAREAAAARERAEADRLLYVALTRAEDWLILCGAERKSGPEGLWYGRLAEAMARCGGVEATGPDGMTVLRLGETAQATEALSPPSVKRPTAPAWIAPARHEERAQRLSPSTLIEGRSAEAPRPGAGRDKAAALAHGRAVHCLLERLGDHPPEQRPVLAERLLLAQMPELAASQRAEAWAEAEAVFAAPFAKAVFGPNSQAEVPIALDLPGLAGQRLLGRIDRLVVTADHVTVIDFKTDAIPPADPAQVEPAYLAQIGAYALALASIYPGRTIVSALLWTATPAMMALPPAPIRAALVRAGIAATGDCLT